MLGITKLTSLARRAAAAVADLIGNVWKTRSSGNQFNQIRWLNNQFVAVGNNNQVAYSSDGVNWNFSNTPRESATVVTWNNTCVAFGNNVYVVATSNGRIFTSTDLTTWTLRTSGTTASINDLFFDGTNFIAVGNTTYCRYSSDNGVTWTAWTTGLPASTTYSYIRHYTGGNYVIASRTTAAPYYATSLGGSWTVGTYDAATFGTLNVVSTNIYGRTTIQYPVLYIGSTTGKIKSSTDGINWADVGLSTATTSINDILQHSVNATVVAIGNTGLIASNAGGTWAVRTTGLTDNGFAVGYTNGRWVCSFNLGNIRYSTDGATWTNPGIYALQDTQGSTANPVTGATIGAPSPTNRFVICTVRGMFTTVDSTTGTFTRAGHFTHYGAGYVKLVNGIYFGMMGNTYIQSNDNGATWLAQGTFPNYIQDVEYANGLYVRCWNNGTIQTSTDTNTWTSRTSGTTFALYSIAYDAAATYKWVIGGAGVMCYSTDGITWAATAPDATLSNTLLRDITNNRGSMGFTRGSTPLAASNQYPMVWNSESSSTHRCVVYNSATNTFTARGTISTSSSNAWCKMIVYHPYSQLYIAYGGTRISTSPDLDTWTVRYTSSGSAFLAVAVGEGIDSASALAVGQSGISVYSGDGGVTWALENTGTTQTFNDVIYVDNNTKFLAVAGGGVTRYGAINNSSTGTIGVTNTINVVTKSPGGTIVVGCSGGLIYYSTNGISWTSGGTTGTSTTVNGLTWSTTHSKFIATSAIGNGSLRVHESTNGTSWTNTAVNILNIGVAPPSYQLMDTNQGLLYVPPSTTYKRLYISKAASTTVLYDVTPYYSNYNFYYNLPPKYLNGNWYFLSGDIQSFKTSNFTTITQVDGTGNSSHFIQTGVFANNQFVVGGTDFYTSSDGETWVKRSTGYNSSYGLKYRNGYYICTSTGTFRAAIVYSADGITWNFTQVDPLDSARAFYFVEYINGYWYCGGSSGYLFRVPNVTSTTGREKIEVGTGDALISIAYDEANKRAIIVGSTGTLVSSNNSGT